MFRSARAAGLLVAVAIGALAAAATTATAAPAPSGSPLPSGNACSNPVLARDATGWSATSGGPGSRVPAGGHVAASYAFRITATATAGSMALPAQAVSGGQRWTFAADSLIMGGDTARLGVDWYDAASRRLAHADGAATAVSATVWTRVPLAATAPSGAVRAVITQIAATARGSLWWSTACAYTTTTTAPTTTTTTPPPTTTTTRPPTTTTTAAPATTTTAPTTTTTAPTTTTTSPTSPPPHRPGRRHPGGHPLRMGHAHRRRRVRRHVGRPVEVVPLRRHGPQRQRRPQQMTVSGGVMTMSGTANGTTGGMGAENGYLYGRWETRMRVPRGDSRYHPVLILWPDAEDWPTGGEVDYAESDCAGTDVDFYLHYSAQNKQTHGNASLDLTQWHNYAVEWTPSGIRGYVDGVQFFSDTTASHLPPRSMHQTIQLDWFPSGSTPTTPSSMQVAWVRYYPV